VAVSYRDKIGFDPTIEGALAKVGLDAQTGELTSAAAPAGGKGSAVGGKPKANGSAGTGGSSSDAAVLSDVANLLDEAQTALDSGDLGTYQSRVDDARKLLEERAAAASDSSAPSSTLPSAQVTPKPSIAPPAVTLPFPGDATSGAIKPKLLSGPTTTVKP
jgi:hypothetical protein